MKKNVLYYVDSGNLNPVWNFIQALPTGERNKCFEYIAYLEEMGESVKRPVGDYLGGKLYELRPKQIRLFYFFIFKDYAVLVHAFRKKSDQLPEREIRIARQCMEDFIIRHREGNILIGE